MNTFDNYTVLTNSYGNITRADLSRNYYWVIIKHQVGESRYESVGFDVAVGVTTTNLGFYCSE